MFAKSELMNIAENPKVVFRLFMFFYFWMSIPHFVSGQARQIGLFSSDSYGGLSVSVQAGNIIYFSAFTQTHGRELWRTDGTEAGTFMVADINPGIIPHVRICLPAPYYYFKTSIYRAVSI